MRIFFKICVARLATGCSAKVPRIGALFGRGACFFAVIAALLVNSPAFAETYRLPLFVTETRSGQQGVLRILNDSDKSGLVRIFALDDSGTRSGPASFTLEPWVAKEFEPADLVSGEGLTGSLENLSDNARLVIVTEFPVVPLVYLRATDDLLSAMHDAVPAIAAVDGGYRYQVPIFNPAHDLANFSELRLANSNEASADVMIEARDDAGALAIGGSVQLTLPAESAITLTSQQLEAGDPGLTGRLGVGIGSWRLRVSSDRKIQVVSRITSSSGQTGNLSTVGPEGEVSTVDDSMPSFDEFAGPGDQDYTEGTAITPLTLPTATGGRGELVYSLSPEVPGLSFDAVTRELTGVPTVADSYSMTYTVTDAEGAADTLSFGIEVRVDTSREPDLGECMAGLIVRAGQRCTYPGTNEEFSVAADGQGRFLVIRSARAINVNGVTFEGQFYDFRASHQGDGVWWLDRVAGVTLAPPTMDDPSSGAAR